MEKLMLINHHNYSHYIDIISDVGGGDDSMIEN